MSTKGLCAGKNSTDTKRGEVVGTLNFGQEVKMVGSAQKAKRTIRWGTHFINKTKSTEGYQNISN